MSAANDQQQAAEQPSEGERLVIAAAMEWFRAHGEPSARREWQEADHRLMRVVARAVTEPSDEAE